MAKKLVKFVDEAPRTGVFEGDLKYGRCNGNVVSKHGDNPANRHNGIAKNQPVAPLTLVQPRDPEFWKRDPRINEVKKNVNNSQHAINRLLETYKDNSDHLRANIHVTFGRQRL